MNYFVTNISKKSSKYQIQLRMSVGLYIVTLSIKIIQTQEKNLTTGYGIFRKVKCFIRLHLFSHDKENFDSIKDNITDVNYLTFYGS